MRTRYTGLGARRRAPPSEPSYAMPLPIASSNTGYSFCEEDYVVTRYVAEFINSLTNLAYGT